MISLDNPFLASSSVKTISSPVGVKITPPPVLAAVKFILNLYSKYICLDEFYKYKNELLINYFSKKIKRPHRPIFLIDKNISYIHIYLFFIKITLKRSEKLSYKFFLFLYLMFHKKGDAK